MDGKRLALHACRRDGRGRSCGGSCSGGCCSAWRRCLLSGRLERTQSAFGVDKPRLWTAADRS
eukprot:4424426-Prymnesium_polylepis.1